jgi:TetR/AcrR family transcriptional regulator, mexCD-oprJ operon repressor
VVPLQPEIRRGIHNTDSEFPMFSINLGPKFCLGLEYFHSMRHMCLMPNDASNNTKERILAAAFQVFGVNPGASILDVANKAGVGRATLYRHFASRHALMVELAQIADHELNCAVETATKDASSHMEGLELALRAIIPLADRQWFLALEPVQNDPKIAALYHAGTQELLETIKAVRKERTFGEDLPDVWIAEVYDGLIYAAWKMVHRGDFDPEQAAELAWQTFLTGIRGT